MAAVDERSSNRIAHDRGAVLVGSLTVVALGTLAIRNPNDSGSYGFCPFLALTGLDCPFCGGLRGTHALLYGDIPLALDHNILLPLLLGGIIASLVVWWRGSWLGFTRGHLKSRWTIGIVAVALLSFWVLRNLPFFPYLDSTA